MELKDLKIPGGWDLPTGDIKTLTATLSETEQRELLAAERPGAYLARCAFWAAVQADPTPENLRAVAQAANNPGSNSHEFLVLQGQLPPGMSSDFAAWCLRGGFRDAWKVRDARNTIAELGERYQSKGDAE